MTKLNKRLTKCTHGKKVYDNRFPGIEDEVRTPNGHIRCRLIIK